MAGKKRERINLLYIFILVIILISAFLAITKGKDTSKIQKAPPPKLSIPNYIQGKLPISFELKQQDYNFPESLALLTINLKNLTKDEAKEISKNLGFEVDPSEFKDVREGVKYIWSNKDKYLIVTPKTATIEYGLNQDLPSVKKANLTDETLTKKANDFLVNNFKLQQDKIEFDSITYLKQSPQTEGFVQASEADAEVYQVNFRYKVVDYPILTIDPRKPLLFVSLLSDGSVYKSEVIVLENLSLSQDLYPIKTYEEVQQSTDQFKLIGIQNALVFVSELKIEDIKSATVEKISLNYLLDSPNSKALQPVFLLEGPVTISSYPTANRIQFYLPAIKDAQ